MSDPAAVTRRLGTFDAVTIGLGSTLAGLGRTTLAMVREHDRTGCPPFSAATGFATGLSRR